MARPMVEFWFEFASTYSYLSAMRLPGAANTAGVSVRWRPFLLGPIFAAQGLTDSPFNIYKAKGAYMWRDVARRAAQQGVPFNRPERFPQNGLLAARVARIALAKPGGKRFCQNVFSAQFAQGRDISNPDVIADCATDAGFSADILDQANAPDNKSELRRITQSAADRGLFGAPSFLVGQELFWGDDRLQDALDWAARHV